MSDFADDMIADEPYRRHGGRLIEGTYQLLIIPEVAAVAQNILHHVEDHATVLFELARKADELRIFLFGQNRFCPLHQFRPGLRWWHAIFLQEILPVVEQSCVDKKGDAEDLTAIAIGPDRRIEELFLLRQSKK